jgi:hypothetical protein
MATPKENLAHILAGLTPGRVREAVLAVANRLQRAEVGVSVSEVLTELTEGLDLGFGPEGWSHELQLKRGVIDILRQIPDMEYVEGDA